MTLFNAETVTLSGLNVIEASAGTGKTYTLAELYLRLVVEKGLTVNQILVVTYTRAATEELRERLRERLAKARDTLLEDPDHDVVSRQRLVLAIQSFDESAIFTIHGFCQRVLTDFAFESGLAFDLELVGEEDALLLSLMDDFWRQHVLSAEPWLARYVLQHHVSPETLLSSIRSLLGKPYLQYLPVEDGAIEKVYHQAQTQFDRVKQLWQQDSDQVIETLRDKSLLNGNQYRQTSVEKWLIALQELLALESVPDALFDGFERFTPARLEKALKKDQLLPELSFWVGCELLLEQVNAIKSAQDLAFQQLRVSALQFIQRLLPERKQQLLVQSYDDLLLRLDQALTGGRGEWLANQLRMQYPAALIDEFQDTDPVQYASFSRIYAGHDLPVFLVGDPKQAIYSFRGADIFTYLSAKKAADQEYNLSTNWRSHPRLVAAVNRLFERQSTPFLYEEIPFYPVGSAREDKSVLVTQDSTSAPLQLLWVESDKAIHKGEMRDLVATTTAEKIATLLCQALNGEATLSNDKDETRAITGGDIAVLVRTGKQGRQIQQCLQQHGINSVQQGQDNVFASAEAKMLHHILKAMAEPDNTAYITAALASPLWPYSLTDLYTLQQDEQGWSEQCDVFYKAHQLWLRRGFISAFRQLMRDINGQQQLLRLQNGDRHLTNLLHLVELLQAQSVQRDGSMSALLHWYNSRIQSLDASDETGQLRLESDEQLVKIITIHKSKGLEYPIVFCPYLWDCSLRAAENEVMIFHERDRQHQAMVAFSEPHLSQAAPLVTQEERAEDLRLLYVALTRARDRCVIFWGNVKGTKAGQSVQDSALFHLLHPSLEEGDSEQMLTDLMTLVENSEDAISLESISDNTQTTHVIDKTLDQHFKAKEFEGDIHAPWRIGSFSALAHGHDAEMPDYDAQTDKLYRFDDDKIIALNRFGFPRGAQAGTCLHTLFELWDFQSDDLAAMHDLVNKVLLQYGFDTSWSPVVCQWLQSVLKTVLDPSTGLQLKQLAPRQRLDELAFYFPVAALSVEALQQTLLPVLTDNSPLARVISSMQFDDLTGFMKGFIDLVFEYQGRFYIVDYKSNYLGTTREQYQDSALDEAMVSHDYPLQYLIYTLALHRYLRLRLPDYDPEQHLGGVYYLFIRGMDVDWGQAGVFYDKPSLSLMMAFDDYLAGLSHD